VPGDTPEERHEAPEGGGTAARLRRRAVVRRFDAPEALETRFYEVRSKSFLNRVPPKSRMPFRWTINPYRGCSHACTYCFARPTHTFLGWDAGRDFEKEIVAKVNAPEVLRAELRRPSWGAGARRARDEHGPVPVGGVEYRIMPGIWEALRDARHAELRADRSRRCCCATSA
jgi:DNA repair photolyase